MKLKTKFGTLFFAIALAGGALVGCNQPADPTPAVTSKYYVNPPAASADYTIAGLNADGYEKGAKVTFTVTLTNPADKEIDKVKYDETELTAGTDGNYSFNMPEKDVRLSVTVKDIKKYALGIGETGLKVDGTTTVTLTYGTTPITDFTVEVVAGTDVVSVSGKTLTGLKKGKFTIAAKVDNAEVARKEFEITKNSKYTIKEAIDEAWEEVTNFNDNSKNTRTKDYYELTGKVVFIGALYSGRYDVFIDDGTDILCHQIVGTESTVFTFEVGDYVKTSTNLTNYYGLVEGYSSDIKYVEKVEEVPNMATTPFVEFDGAKFDTLAATYAAKNERRKITPVIFDATAVKITEGEGDDAEEKNRYQIAGATALNNGRVATTASVIDMKWVEGATYHMKGYARNASQLHMNIVVTEQQAQAAKTVAINGDASFELALNNTRDLTYTVTPVGAGETVEWKSSEPTIVSVDENGKIKALAAGEADITVKVDNVTSAPVHVTVPNELVHATSVTIKNKTSEIVRGKELALTVEVEPEGCTDAVAYDSSNKEVATVSKDGKVSTLANGTTTISVTCGEHSDSFALTVRDQKLADLADAKVNDAVDTYGYFMGKYEANKGYWIGDGNYAIYVYDNAPTGAVKDSIIHVVGKIGNFNACKQVASLTKQEVVETYAGLTTPATLTIDETFLTAGFTVAHQGRYATVTGVVKSAPSGGTSGTYVLTVGKAELNVFVNKNNMGETAYNKFLTDMVVGRTTTLEGYVVANKSKGSFDDELTLANYQLVNPVVKSYVEIPVESISLSESALELEPGQETTLNVTFAPAGSSAEVEWSVTGSDKVTAVGGLVKVANDATAGTTATITATAAGKTATCTVTVKTSFAGTIDKIVQSDLSAETTSYTITTGLKDASTAEYWAGANRASDGVLSIKSETFKVDEVSYHAGVVSTKSGGKIKLVRITFPSSYTTARNIDVYCKNEAYETADDLFVSAKQGTKVGTISYTGSAPYTITLEIEGDYTFVGIRSNDKAIQISSIEFGWVAA